MSNGVRFTRATTKRLAEVTRYVEQQPRSHAPLLGGPTHFGGSTMLVTNSTIPAMSGSTPGAGTGKIQKFNGTSYSDLTTTAYPILNDTDKNVSSGAYVLCVPGPGGKYHLVVAHCANLS